MSSKYESNSELFSLIVVPHDGSAASDSALSYETKIAKVFKSKLTILYVIPEILLPQIMFDRPIRSKITGDIASTHEYLKEIYQELKTEGIKLLESKKKEIESAGSEAELRVVIGHPGDKIIEFAEEERANLIVMGTTGLTGISKVRAIGSVARRVSERAKCPVMFIH
jgi:nucleotide-binding universal stress UspA family protein